MTDLPPGWEWATLEDLVSLEARAMTDGPFGSNLKSSHYTASGARVIRLQNIGDGQFIDERAYISLEHFEKLKAHEVHAGDLVVASLGDNPPRTCLIPDLDAPAVVKADCIRVRLHSEVHSKWVLYALLAPATKRYAAARIRGVGRPRLGMNEIRRIPIPVPPLAEQRRIVAALEDHLARLTYGLDCLEQARNRTAALVGSVRDAYLCGVLDSLPPSWRRGHLREVLTDIEAGKSFACESRPAQADEWGIIKVSAMTWGEFRDHENKAVPDGHLVDRRYEIQPGDILVSRANTPAYVGAPVLVRNTRPKLLLSDKSLRLKPLPDIDREWLLQVLSAPSTRRQITERATGTKDSMRNISQQSLLDVEIPIAPPEVQISIGLRVRALIDDISRTRSELDRLERYADSLRRSILAEAFAGRLVPQDLADEPAAELLARIRAERAASQPKRRTRRTTRPVQKETLL